MSMRPDPETVDAVRPFLEEGENIRWTGKPRQGIMLRATDAFLIPFSIAWGGFAIFWEAMAISMGAPFFFALFGVPFVLIGLQLMIGRFFTDASQRKKTHYVITDRRAMILYQGKTTKVSTWNAEEIGKVELSLKADGSGNVKFGPTAQQTNMTGMSFPGTEPSFGASFELTGDAKTAAEELNKLKNERPVSELGHGSFWESEQQQYEEESKISQEEGDLSGS